MPVPELNRCTPSFLQLFAEGRPGYAMTLTGILTSGTIALMTKAHTDLEQKSICSGVTVERRAVDGLSYPIFGTADLAR